jgi:hypothetical protein
MNNLLISCQIISLKPLYQLKSCHKMKAIKCLLSIITNQIIQPLV